jgi:hypothetical protein
MATNNNGNLLDDAGNVVVDFVWGNFPMQPNDDRSEAVQGDLDATLNDHVIAYAGWNGYPLYTPNDDGAGVGYINVPSVIGVATATAQDTLDDAGLTVTTASAATNSAKTITAVSRTTGSTTIRFTASTHGYSANQKVTVSGLASEFNDTWTIVNVPNANAFDVTGTSTASYGATGLSGSVVAVSGTIKTQSVAAGGATIAVGQAVTITPWA